ncbi:MAG TPA: YggT family protein [Rhodocyclaceae bacterium]|jgi:YggT family protein|nr:YggT family protein [Rhodocyclaceae bacterium]
MIVDFLLYIVKLCAELFGSVFLIRFMMQWVRAPFRNPLGRFIFALSDWAVVPLRRVLPGFWGVDMSSLVLAWLVQCLYYLFAFFGSGVGGFDAVINLAVHGTVAIAALIETARLFLYLVFGITVANAVLSWVNPHAPLASVLDALAEPFLRPFRRFIPPIGGIDISPIALILVVQLLLRVLSELRYSFFVHG